MGTINWTLNVQVAGGPQIAVPRSRSFQAYDRIEVIIAPDTTAPKTVEIQPAAKVAQVGILLITSSWYDPKLTYTVNNGTKEIQLDQPHLYSGGMIALLSDAPKELKFKNTDKTNKAVIEILVGRDAIPTP